MTKRPESVGGEVLFEVRDHVAIVTLNRPEKRNAVNGAVTTALDWIVQAVDNDPEIRVAILTSSSEKVFCAGADLAAISAGDGYSLVSKTGGFAGFTDAPKKTPWIAAVRGSAFGGGMELVLACDMIVAGEDAAFGLPEVKRGLIAGAGGAYRLPRAIPSAVATEIILTGDVLTAGRASELGMLNALVAGAEVDARAMQIALAIAANAPLAVKESLSIIRQAHDLKPDELQKKSYEGTVRLASTEDAREGPMAFLEKRAPVWKGR